MKKVFIFCLCLMFVVAPSLSLVHAANIWTDGFVPCGNEADPQVAATSCNFDAFMQLVDNVIQGLFYFGILITVFLVTKTGFKYLTAGSKPGQLEEAKKSFWNILIGFALMLGAWLIINTAINILINPASGIENPLK